MPVTKYTKTISTDFGSAATAPNKLTGEIDANATITKTVDHINVNPGDATDTCDIYMSDALTGAEETELGTVCTNHNGVETTIQSPTAAYVPLINPDANGDVSVTQDTTWQTVARHAANPGFYVPNLAQAKGRYTVDYLSDDTGGTPQMKIVEQELGGANPVDLTSSPASAAGTSGSQDALQFTTDVTPRNGLYEYLIQARLNSGTTLKVRGVAVALLRILVV